MQNTLQQLKMELSSSMEKLVVSEALIKTVQERIHTSKTQHDKMELKIMATEQENGQLRGTLELEKERHSMCVLRLEKEQEALEGMKVNTCRFGVIMQVCKTRV